MDLRCQQIRQRIHQWLDQGCDPRHDPQVQEHVKSCPRCAEELAGLVWLDTWARGLKPPDPPPELVEKVLRRLFSQPAARPESNLAGSRRKGWTWAVLGLALSGALLLLSFPGSNSLEPRQAQKEPPVCPLARFQEELRKNFSPLAQEAKARLAQTRILLSTTNSSPGLGTTVLEGVGELVQPLRGVMEQSATTLGGFWARVVGQQAGVAVGNDASSPSIGSQGDANQEF